MIGHEREVPVWWDEGEDALRLPALKPHARVETDIIEETRILSGEKKKAATVSFELAQADPREQSATRK